MLEALGLFDVDTDPGVLAVDGGVVPTLHLADVSKNYRPALNQRLAARVGPIGPALGNFGGCSIGSNLGFWCLAVSNFSASATLLGVGVSIDSTFLDSIVLTPLNWNKVGSSPGDVRALQQAPQLRCTFGNFPAAPPNAPAWGIEQGVAQTGFFPLWVPGGGYLNVVNATSNTSCDFCIALQIPALSDAWF